MSQLLPNCSHHGTLGVLEELIIAVMAKNGYGRERQSATDCAVRRIAQLGHDTNNQHDVCQAQLEFTDKRTQKRNQSEMAYAAYAIHDKAGDCDVEVQGLQALLKQAALTQNMGGLQ
ncbi:hypothetical protein [Lampropedia aestuarii]|uniref:hypothetical protein n=1 Tax=Lampropedia aestuarii TaxID=2562762 RepID=UPI00246943CD|nr:hypothetical protein [Lampropedia aestuarii]MDH5859185.1 hypothetical protein [Lampropedia aestuarii]